MSETSSLPDRAIGFLAVVACTPNRAAVLRYLLTHPEGASSVDMGAALRMSTTVALSHLIDLEDLGVVDCSASRLASGRRQRSGVYRLKVRGFSAEELAALQVLTGIGAATVLARADLDDFTPLELIAEAHRRLFEERGGEPGEPA
ncbi:hypothetical protein O159_27130 [Leifsonia xyli subsp. cynodontis DSM 46306]|uniref:Uncharacterized protein n=1 Tax=Leifsonia xyli subsp. cynodontis DSM 46306 TaxID=1389489 RepID=U3P9U2_LEIXC|nr:hypothetical protein [Leifsonia xyli]AGW42611.1 hypothetical protein O159_27130 [Leifsonia xyli subsp. cynodontis DSM 46306]